MATGYNVLNKPIDDLLEECDTPDDIAYAIQKLGFAAKILVAMDRDKFPTPDAGQVWKVETHGIVMIIPDYRSALKVVGSTGKDICKKDDKDKLRLWLYQRSGMLVAHNLQELAYTAYPYLDGGTEAEADTTEIALLPE